MTATTRHHLREALKQVILASPEGASEPRLHGAVSHLVEDDAFDRCVRPLPTGARPRRLGAARAWVPAAGA